MLDGLVEHVERLPGTLVQELVQQEGEPGAEHLLRHALRAPEQQLVVRLALHAPLFQVTQQGLQDVRAVFHPGKGTVAWDRCTFIIPPLSKKLIRIL
jgi:hypothetical protein